VGVQSTICGSYIRGKAFSGDLDIIMTVADDQDTSRGLRQGVKEALLEMGVDLIVLKDAAEGGFHTKTTAQHEKVESHQNILTMIKFEGKYRRVDIITSPFNQYAFAILGWAGASFHGPLMEAHFP
jgi:DNA polymerase/3'-5' exonuclease PolX